MKALLKNLGLMAAAGALSGVGQYVGVLRPSPWTLIASTAIAAAAAHWFPPPSQDGPK